MFRYKETVNDKENIHADFDQKIITSKGVTRLILESRHSK
jgi:hypothetical protein